jgi:hypothetical protein
VKEYDILAILRQIKQITAFVFYNHLLIPSQGLDATSQLRYSEVLKMEATSSFETPIYFKRTTRRYNPQDGILHNERCDNLKSYTVLIGLAINAVA